MAIPHRRRSLEVSLVLLSAAALAGCGERGAEAGDVAARDQYLKRSDCVEDWGDDQCPPRSSGGGVGYFYGPYRMGSGLNPSPRAFGLASETLTPETARGINRGAVPSTISRGGFGGSGGEHGGSS